MAQITINMTGADFDWLCTLSSTWTEGLQEDWAYGRYQNMTTGTVTDTPPSRPWKHAYWLGDSWTTVLLARAFLATQGHAYEVLWDMNENPEPQYLILTDYATGTQRKAHGFTE